MVLWRPLFEGLADGIRSPVRSSAGGLGCLVPRASLLALRAILLRHGRLFTVEQLCAILEQTVLPAIQESALSDESPVIHITSESPSVSSIDFLADPLPLPPRGDDPKLLLFEASSSTQNRPMGSAELMLEASFTDLRHGGDGDLRRAYILAKKSGDMDSKPHEQPFPDSWLATSAPTALGILTDILTEIVPAMEPDEAGKVWSIVAGQYKLWFLGTPVRSPKDSSWRPCEALVRISCREVGRLAEHICGIDQKNNNRAKDWDSLILSLFSDLLSGSTESQRLAYRALMESKEKAMCEMLDNEAIDDEDVIGSKKTTSFGEGRLVQVRTVRYEASSPAVPIITEVPEIELAFGATLYSPRIKVMPTGELTSKAGSNDGIPQEVDGML